MSKKFIIYFILLLGLVLMSCKTLPYNYSSVDLWILSDGELSINTEYIDKVPKELIIPDMIDGFEVNSLSSEIFTLFKDSNCDKGTFSHRGAL